MTDTLKIYQSNIEKYQALRTKLDQHLNRLSLLRLAVFVLSFIIITLLANDRQLGLVLLMAPMCLLGFGWLVKRYNGILQLQQHAGFLLDINQHEIQRLGNDLSSFPPGKQFISRDHPYSSDLDIFGQHSLFQLLNRTTTESGRVLLAEWLTRQASQETIVNRQQSIKELAPMLEWRQDFQASGMPFDNAKNDYKKLLDWFEKPVELLPQSSKYLTIAITLSILTTIAQVYFLINILSPNPMLYLAPLIIILMINIFVLYKLNPVAEDIIEHTYHNVSVLQGYTALIQRIEVQLFSSYQLQKLKSNLSNETSASLEINRLKQMLRLFQLRGFKKEFSSLFYALSNWLWLVDIHCILKIEKWKIKNRSNLEKWAAAVSEFEVLCSLAGFAYSNPAFTFPEFSEDPYQIGFQKLGHPLITEASRVCNEFDLIGQGEIAVITGSNMAGKSTFLRTVGINLVLAFSGAPICAKSSKVSILNIFTSMRTQDNLETGVSSFFAELKRVEQLLQAITDGQPLLFLLDELFKGTNSEDRHKGGVSLILQLCELNAFGIIATHDLELARLVEKQGVATNYSFNSQMQGGEMIFSYELTDDICSDFNASELMKRSGIKVISEID